jgi:hypothetical protein
MAVNPFTPTFGVTPPLLVGRHDEIDDFRGALEEGVGSPERVTLVTGLRGTGKTVMLNAYEDVARSEGWLIISETAGRGMLERITNTAIPELLRLVDPDQARSRVTGVGVAGVSVQRQVTETNAPEPNFRYRMNQLLDAISVDTGVLITVDEIHRSDDMELLGSTIQHLRREGRNVAFVGAGLPRSVHELLSSERPTTFLRRADRRHLGAVRGEDVREALLVPIEEAGKRIDTDALSIAVEGTQGYPFMIQLVGREIWRASAGESITAAEAKRGIDRARRKIGQLVHEPALADLSAMDRSFLVAMAQDEEGPSRMYDIAQRLDVTSGYASQYRLRLINAEIIQEAGHGSVDFTIPYLREYLRDHAASSVR